MDCFYIITNKLKDRDYKITNEIRNYIEEHGKKCILSEKDSEGHIIPGTVPEDAQCMQGIGYKEVVECLKNNDLQSTMYDIILKNTRNYCFISTA